MPKIPLQKFAQKEFPMTPRSTVHHWAKQAQDNKEGPLAGMIERVGGRWYVNVGDPTTDKIVSEVKALVERSKSAMAQERQRRGI
jgi:hypothetical protein